MAGLALADACRLGAYPALQSGPRVKFCPEQPARPVLQRQDCTSCIAAPENTLASSRSIGPAEQNMSTERPSAVAPICLIVGALLGLAGSFAPSASLRGLAWGIDGTALIVAAALLAVHCLRQNYHSIAAGFVVFIAGETLVLAGSAMSLEASSPLFAAGAALWGAALLLVSIPDVMPLPVRALGSIAAVVCSDRTADLCRPQPNCAV